MSASAPDAARQRVPFAGRDYPDSRDGWPAPDLDDHVSVLTDSAREPRDVRPREVS